MRPLFILTLASALATWQGGPDACAQAIAEPAVRAHIDFLADDLLEGRDSGFRGSELAALYIETWFRTHAIAPLLDDYRQPVAIAGASGRGSASVTVSGRTHASSDQIEPFAWSSTGRFEAPLAAGGGDVRDRILLVPGGDDERRAREVAAEALGAGARAVVFISAEERFERRVRPDPRRRFRRTEPRSGGGMLSAGEDGPSLAPVVRVNRLLGADLLEFAERGEAARVTVEREGRDETVNVIGWIEGRDPELRSEYVVVGAHFDHVGQDAHGNIWNGADDNASGTAAVLEMARALARSDGGPRRSVVFALWGAEERGLYGSREFVKTAPIPIDRIAAYINLDMISRNDPAGVMVIHASDDLFEMSRQFGSRHGLEAREGFESFLRSSDTEPFVRQRVPTVFFFSGLHQDYHTATDDPPTADADKATRVARTALDVAMAVADADARPAYTNPRGRTASRVLGIVIADKATGDDGVRVRTVSPGSVAGAAGLRAGDVILRIAGLPVRTLSDLRDAIKAPKAGEEFEIDVLREHDAGAGIVTLRAEFVE